VVKPRGTFWDWFADDYGAREFVIRSTRCPRWSNIPTECPWDHLSGWHSRNKHLSASTGRNPRKTRRIWNGKATGADQVNWGTDKLNEPCVNQIQVTRLQAPDPVSIEGQTVATAERRIRHFTSAGHLPQRSFRIVYIKVLSFKFIQKSNQMAN
jgi:hypothetical protein